MQWALGFTCLIQPTFEADFKHVNKHLHAAKSPCDSWRNFSLDSKQIVDFSLLEHNLHSRSNWFHITYGFPKKTILIQSASLTFLTQIALKSWFETGRLVSFTVRLLLPLSQVIILCCLISLRRFFNDSLRNRRWSLA